MSGTKNLNSFATRSSSYNISTAIVLLCLIGATLAVNSRKCNELLCSEGVLDGVCHCKEFNTNIPPTGLQKCTLNDYDKAVDELFAFPKNRAFRRPLFAACVVPEQKTQSGSFKLPPKALIPIENPIIKTQRFFDNDFLNITHRRYDFRINNHDKYVRQLSKTRREETHDAGNRIKRSTKLTGGSQLVKTLGVTWKLQTSYNDPTLQLTAMRQRDEIRLALASWERVSTVCFVEDNNSGNNVDLLVSFLGQHSGHAGFNGGVGHTRPRNFIHLNRAWRFALTASFITASFPSTSAVLQRVVQHEIGHYLNFNHHGGPVMTAGYNKRSNPPTLGSQDRNQLRDQFGRCSGRFDAQVDIQWVASGNLFYRTLLTRDNIVWQYSNSVNAPVGRYPVSVSSEFPNFNGNPTAIFQVYSRTTTSITIDDVIVIKGSTFRKYQATANGMTDLNESGSVTVFGLPSNTQVDAAVFDHRSDVIYFFDDNKVHEVRPNRSTQSGQVISYTHLSQSTIASKFPAQTNNDYFSGVNSAYIHIVGNGEMYLTKNKKIYENRLFSFAQSSPYSNQMVFRGSHGTAATDDLWSFVCDPFRCK